MYADKLATELSRSHNKEMLCQHLFPNKENEHFMTNEIQLKPLQNIFNVIGLL